MRAEGVLQACDARPKVALAMAALLLAVAARQPATPLLLATFAFGSGLATGIPLRVLLCFLSGIAVTAGIPFLLLALSHDLAGASLLSARVVGASAVGSWLLASTDFPRLRDALAWFRLPSALLELLGYAHRYAGVLHGGFRTAYDAQALRLGHAGLRRSLRSVGVLCGLVFGRAIDQTATLSEALALRGYRGELLPTPCSSLGRADALVVALGCSAFFVSTVGAFWVRTVGAAWITRLTGGSSW